MDSSFNENSIKVTIYSDIACPWCYVGQKRLRNAIDTWYRKGGKPIGIEWKPYQIDPGTAINGEEFEAYNQRRWGSSGWTYHLKEEGRNDGATFRNWPHWPNTLRAHQWIQYGVQNHNADTDTLNSILFHALYEQGINISLVDELIKLGREHFGDNCNINELRNYLQNNVGAVEVQKEISNGRKNYNIRGVPYFIISNSKPNSSSYKKPYLFSGAQKSTSFLEVFHEINDE